MTSPNVNVFILLGTVLGYVSVVLLGLDVTIVDDVQFDGIVQVRHARPFGSDVLIVFSRVAYSENGSIGRLQRRSSCWDYVSTFVFFFF